MHQQNPDIAAFVSRGGKLLLWHGFNDPGPSPLSTIEYFEAVNAEVPGGKDAVRLFLAPGVLHCGGGAGPDRFDALTALENWVEKGVAARVDDRDQGELAGVAAALSVSAAAALQRIGRPERGGELRVRAVGSRS